MPKIVTFVLLLLTPLLHAQTDSIPVVSIAEVEVVSTVKTPVTKTVTPTQTINSEDIARIGIQSVSDAVRRFSGVVVKDYGGVGGMKTVSIRGMGAQHTAVSYDGMTFSNAQSGAIDIGFFSLDNISEISLTIGQSDNIFQTARAFASAGILSIETSAPYFSGKSYKGSVHVKTGSFGYFNPAIYYAHKLNTKFSLSGNLNWERTDGKYPYEFENVSQTEKGKRRNSDVDILRSEINLYGNLSESSRLKVKVNYFDSERGVPNKIVLYNTENKDRIKNRDLIAQAQYKNELSTKLSFQTNAKFSKFYYNFLNARDLKRERIDQEEYYLSAGISYTPFRHVSVSLTEDVSYNKLKDNFANYSNDPERKTSLTLLASQYKNDFLTVTGSLLATVVSEDNKRDSPVDENKISPFIGLTYRPLKITDLRIRAFYKNIFRLPSFSEMYYTARESVVLKPESTEQYNVGITWNGYINNVVDYISLSVDGYRNYVDDKILVVPNGSTPTVRNLGKVRGTGLDVNLKAQVNVRKDVMIGIWGTYGYQEVLNMNKESVKAYKHQIPYTPEHYGSFAVSCDNPWVNISYTAVLSGMRYFMDENIPDNELDSYSDHSVSLSKLFTLKDKRLNVQFSLLNIGNKNYQIVRYYLMPKRSFSFSANLSF